MARRGRPAYVAGMQTAELTPPCPRCGAPMRLARVVPHAFGMPELRSFECVPCREAVTLEFAPSGVRLPVQSPAE